jgi:hypothetical protein
VDYADETIDPLDGDRPLPGSIRAGLKAPFYSTIAPRTP